MSFIQVDKDSDFPLQNLPYGVFSTKEEVSNSNLCPWSVVIVLRLCTRAEIPGNRGKGKLSSLSHSHGLLTRQQSRSCRIVFFFLDVVILMTASSKLHKRNEKC